MRSRFPPYAGAFGAHTNIPLLYKEVAPNAKSPNWGWTEEKLTSFESSNACEAGEADWRKMIKVIAASLSISCVVYGCRGLSF